MHLALRIPKRLNMKLFLKYVILILFAFYWLLTFLIVLPKNYISIQASESIDIFNKTCPQVWTFFSPPPQSNQRLYYEVYDSIGQLVSKTEVLDKIYEYKRENKPFNYEATFVDYLVNYNLMRINEITLQAKKTAEYRNISKDSITSFVEKLSLVNLKLEFKSLYRFGVYSNHLSNQRAKSNYKIRFFITDTKINKLIDRYRKNTFPEMLLITSPLINIRDIEN